MAHQPNNLSAGTQVVSRIEVRGTNCLNCRVRKHARRWMTCWYACAWRQF